MERCIQKLEEAVGIRKLSPLELSKAIHDLQDMKQAFYNHLDSRITIKEGLQKYQTR